MSAPVASRVLETWTGPLESPPLGEVRVADFDPAFEAAFTQHLAEIAAVAGQPDEPHLPQHHRRAGALRPASSAGR